MAIQSSAPTRPQTTGHRVLRATGGLWFATAVIGLMAFAYFILAFYGSRTLRGDFPAWNDKALIDGYIAEDVTGNVMFITHVLLAAVMTIGGLVQLVPGIRTALPAVHRWNGRLFLTIAVVLAVGGFWLTWGRGTQLSLISGIAVTLNGVLILVFAGMAWRFAIARDFETHSRWALRTFMVANGVWFLRVSIMAWAILNQGPVGMNGTLSGPADIFLVFACYLIPLAGLELYLAGLRSEQAWVPWAVAPVIVVLTAIMGVGIAGAIAFMWWPNL